MVRGALGAARKRGEGMKTLPRASSILAVTSWHCSASQGTAIRLASKRLHAFADSQMLPLLAGKAGPEGTHYCFGHGASGAHQQGYKERRQGPGRP